jgi:murein L,D-transpeptidase YafK
MNRLMVLLACALAACGSRPLAETAPAPKPRVEAPRAEALGAEVLIAPPARPRPTVADPTAWLPVTRAPLRPYTLLDLEDASSPLERAARARRRTEATVRAMFEDASISYPPATLLLRAFKHERELEVWAGSTQDGAMARITSYGICAASGELGPKRREGDLQVPEGYYKIAYLWPASDYHLSMKVNYPNTSDKILGHKRWPGSDIMIHGSCASIGCLAMSDERIEEIYTMSAAAQARSRVEVHIYPMRRAADLETLPTYARHRDFWDNLYRGYTAFEQTAQMPEVSVNPDGSYRYVTR